MTDAITRIFDIPGNVIQALNKVGKWISEKASDVFNFIKNEVFNKVWGWIKSIIKKASDWFINLLTNLFKKFYEKIPKILSIVFLFRFIRKVMHNPARYFGFDIRNVFDIHKPIFGIAKFMFELPLQLGIGQGLGYAIQSLTESLFGNPTTKTIYKETSHYVDLDQFQNVSDYNLIFTEETVKYSQYDIIKIGIGGYD